MKLISLFSGCGGLDLGFEKAGFKTIWANEYDKTIWDTYSYNFPDTVLDRRSIVDVPSVDIPSDIDGIIGGPPCQSWSEAGSGRGINDSRGKLFYEYIRILKDKQPKFFLAENVAGILFEKHAEAFNDILNSFRKLGYNISYKLLNAKNYNVPQDRKRVIIIGYHERLNKSFTFPTPSNYIPTLRDSIYDLNGLAVPALDKNKTNGHGMNILNNEYMTGGWSTMFMSRNRVRTWDEPSFTIQAGGRHAPIHPSAPQMEKVGKDKFIFKKGFEKLYRRLSLRECARIQTFPDSHKFVYNSLADGYKMVGNAVPVEFATALATKIYIDLAENHTAFNHNFYRKKDLYSICRL
ncbi:MAG: DNA (cytosine-5-)-methyltransferase [Alphaproteobacteria bacterium CG11_big_fil_rev_8_21_14_0_20_39_49]|nr:MAG: DNA (cytosine-5-)-methyltransferase [Alphaproteobacteria bacterium CG11_big_fil_rev_8_21_14_0_20_39_49]